MAVINVKYLFWTILLIITAYGATESSIKSSDGTTVATNLLVLSTSVLETSTDDNVTSNNTMETGNSTQTPVVPTVKPDHSYLEVCPDNAPCVDLGASCIDCKLNHYCTYGIILSGNCTVKKSINCTGARTFLRPYICSYAFQLEDNKVFCDNSLATSCSMKKSPPEKYLVQCRVREEVLCLGNRTFYKRLPCNWTSGYKWSTALVLSITLGGFGVDRFYLGLWREAMGKLFSFGGLGVWTLVDVILIAMGYVGPHDDSLYVYPWN